MRALRTPGTGFVLVAVLAGLLLTGCATTSSDQKEVLGRISSEVTESRFGVVVPGPQGPTLVGTRVVPLIPGTTFGWQLRVAETESDVEFREVYTLPAPPGSVEGGARQKDPTVVEREARGSDEEGWIMGFWTLDAGDPPGRHVIDIYFDDALAYTFEFDILIPREPEAKPAPAP